ncbi:MAG: NAD(P)-binding protein, partial [Proteobacteria bacterium]|nr:NAD(P)-binding protein [Pseudomonadota bacterium]
MKQKRIRKHARRKIAILGGGVGAIISAFELTNQPGWQDRFDITVYQMGWRLGGKAASGRNRAQGNRIEELGPHVWAGFYDQAFHAFQACHAELERAGLLDGVFQDWRDAFTAQDKISVLQS